MQNDQDLLQVEFHTSRGFVQTLEQLQTDQEYKSCVPSTSSREGGVSGLQKADHERALSGTVAASLCIPEHPPVALRIHVVQPVV